MRFYRSLLFIIAGLLTLTHLPVQAGEVRTYHDSITSLTDTVRLLQPDPSATALTLEIRFTMPGKNHSRSRAVSLLWNVADSINYSALTLTYGSDGFDTTFDKKYALLSYHKVVEARDSLIFSERVESPYAVPAAENAIAVTLDAAGSVGFLFGHPLPEEIASIAGDFNPALPVGISADGTVSLSLVVTDMTFPAEEGISDIIYSSSQIEQLIGSAAASVSGSPVGIWEYLDRDTENVRARSGGRYRLAVVPSVSSSGYDIVYLGGAEVNPSAWRPGMIKGRLIPTPFAGHFDLRWVDSSLTPIREDVHASLDSSNAILTLSFPLLGSTIRLYRP